MSLDFILKGEFSRFLVVGAINTAFSYCLYFLINLAFHYQMAYGMAYAVSVLSSYWLNSRWVFKTRMDWRTFLSFPLVYIVQYCFGAVLLHVLVEILGMSEWWSPIVVIVLSVPVTFSMSRVILKRKL